MTTQLATLSRTAAGAREAAPIRIVHLGLGNFFRAHQAFYTDRSPDAAEWGIAGFTGRSTALSDALSAQDGLYTLITRSADGDSSQWVSSLSRAHHGADTEAWLGYLADPQVAIVTLTVTEAAYLRDPSGGIDHDNPFLIKDLAALRQNLESSVSTVPARLVAGFAARRAADAGPIAVVPCDNLPENGAVVADVVGSVAAIVDPALAEWIASNVSFVTTMVDRITPATTDEDRPTALALTGLPDTQPVVTEPFSEWVLAGNFPAGRPAWEVAGARFVDNIGPFEERKLWLLNGAHSLLAYAGSARGHLTIAEAVGDPDCRAWVRQWWDEASAELTLPAGELAAYCDALLGRFDNPRIRHLLAQIAGDGSLKIPVRILPVIRRYRARGEMPAAALRVIAAWIAHLRGAGAAVTDVAAQRFIGLASGDHTGAVGRVLQALDPALAADPDVVNTVVAALEDLDSDRP